MPGRLRSLLFVPGHKPEWIAKALAAGPDGVIIDLEDAVAPERKAFARECCGASLRQVLDAGVAAFVRVNPWGGGALLDDLLALGGDAPPTGIMLPKVEHRREVTGLDQLLTELEVAWGCPPGSVEIMPNMESARGIVAVRRLCASSLRVRRCPGGPTNNPNGDTARSLGVRVSEGGEEMLYAYSKTILEARAAGVLQVFGGMSSMVELEPLRRTIERARRLGCFGAIVIHPSHVAVANEMYQPTKAEIRSAEAIVAGLRAARAAGDAATVVAGRMVDIAHARTAAILLREAAEWGHPVDPDLVAEAD